MEDYVEEYKYNNNFWMKSDLLYSHSEKKFQEYLSIGKMIESFSNIFNYFYEEINKIPSLYKRPEEEKSTRYNGIQVLIKFIKNLSDNIKILKFELEKIYKNLFEKELRYTTIIDMCENDHKNYKDALTRLKINKENYFESINKAIEINIASKIKGKYTKINHKILNEIEQKRKEYKAQIEKVEKIRVDYMELQGALFSYEEEYERECTNDLKTYINKYIKAMETFRNNIIIKFKIKKL